MSTVNLSKITQDNPPWIFCPNCFRNQMLPQPGNQFLKWLFKKIYSSNSLKTLLQIYVALRLPRTRIISYEFVYDESAHDIITWINFWNRKKSQLRSFVVIQTTDS